MMSRRVAIVVLSSVGMLGALSPASATGYG
jgi:hypothetical protein